jgi:hypothetical protein
VKLKIVTEKVTKGWLACAHDRGTCVMVSAEGRTEKEARSRLLRKLESLTVAAWEACQELKRRAKGAKR